MNKAQFLACTAGLLLCAGHFSRLQSAAPETAPEQAAQPQLPPSGIDLVVLGDSTSEQAHGFGSDHSEAIKGLLEEPARHLLPLESPTWYGGKASFKMKVDPAKQNYFTARFSGDDQTQDRLVLYVEGKQIGWRHLGEIESLDYGTAEPAYAGRFYYNTAPLPLSLTKGKSELQFEIRSCGRLWGYGQNFEQLQKNVTQPSRGIYRVYTHTEGFFIPASDEKQGAAPAGALIRKAPGLEVMDQIKERVNSAIDGLLMRTPRNQMELEFLSKCYDVKWTHAFENPKVIDRIVAGLDGQVAAFRKDPKLAEKDWPGFGPCGGVIAFRKDQLSTRLDASIDDGKDGKITRREALLEMLLASRDFHRLHRLMYTNQSMITDVNIYLANRGIAVLDPSKALPEPQVRKYLYEAVGVEPWLGSDNPLGTPSKSMGEDYYLLTPKGLTKELGYVGTYGEVIDLIADIYNATRSGYGQPGDERIKAQLVKASLARSWFRNPALDREGNRTFRLEQIVGWRDSHYPGVISYGQRASRTASGLQAAAITQDPRLVGYAQQMIADNQFFSSELEAMKETGLNVTLGRLETPQEYELITALPSSSERLPMGWDQPDRVFSDEEDGVLVVKNGDEIFCASLYWRARHGINNLARVHYLTPRFDRLATVCQETQFEPSGMEYTRPNWTTFGFGNGGLKYPGPELQSAHAGEILPIAKIPDNIPFTPGEESVYAGKGSFYTLRYGPYLVGMNLTKDKTFELKVPIEAKSVRELVSQRSGLSAGSVEKVGPKSTLVLFIEK